MYAGNEGPIEDFAAATGYQWVLGEELGALVVFAEHRGYGRSAPPPLACAGGLSHIRSEEALSDYAALVYIQLEA